MKKLKVLNKKTSFFALAFILVLLPFIFNATSLNEAELSFKNDSGLIESTFTDEDKVVLDVIAIKNDMILTPTLNLNDFLDTYEEQFNQITVGMIQAFAIPDSAIPTGWLLCDGAEVSRATFGRLFGVIGTTWGTPTNEFVFKVPDMRGYFIRGASGTVAVGDTRFLTSKSGKPKVAGSGNMVITTSSGGEHTHIFDDTALNQESKGVDNVAGNIGMDDDNAGLTSSIIGSGGIKMVSIHMRDGDIDGIGSNSTSGSHLHSVTYDNPLDTRPKNVGVVYAIKF